MVQIGKFARVWALPISLLVAGCAASPIISDVSLSTATLARYSAVQVEIDAPHEVLERRGFGRTSAALREEFIAHLTESNRFAPIGASHEPRSRTLVARLTITDLNYVHGAARGILGIAAGRAVLNVTMMLKDKESGSVIGIMSAGHRSHHGQGAFSPTTGRQVSAIAKELAARLTAR